MPGSHEVIFTNPGGRAAKLIEGRARLESQDVFKEQRSCPHHSIRTNSEAKHFPGISLVSVSLSSGQLGKVRHGAEQLFPSVR
jgi:hypothetical protein